MVLAQARKEAIVERPRQSVRIQNKRGRVDALLPCGQLFPDALFGQHAREQLLNLLREQRRSDSETGTSKGDTEADLALTIGDLLVAKQRFHLVDAAFTARSRG